MHRHNLCEGGTSNLIQKNVCICLHSINKLLGKQSMLHSFFRVMGIIILSYLSMNLSTVYITLVKRYV